MSGDVAVYRRGPVGPTRMWEELGGPLVTGVVLAVLHLLSSTSFGLPSPVGVGLLVTAVSALLGGWRPGLISAGMVVVYGVVFYSVPGGWLEFAGDGGRRVLVLALVAPALAVLVGGLRRRITQKVTALEAAHDRLARQRTELESQRAELELQQTELEQLLEELSIQRDELEERQAKLVVERGERLDAFRVLGRAIAAERSESTVLAVMTETVEALTRARGVALSRLDVEREALAVISVRGAAAGLTGLAIPRRDSAMGRCLAERTPVRLEAAAAHPAMRDAVLDAGAEQLLIAPVFSPLGEPLAALLVVDPAEDAEDAMRVLATVADHVGAALERIELQRRSARRVRRARVFGDAMDRLRDGVLVADRTGRIRYANAAAAAIYGVERPELVGRSLESLHSPGAPNALLHGTCAAASEDGWAGESVHQREDGTPVPVHVTKVVARRSRGRAMAFVVIVHDLTESRRVQAQLLESEKLATVGGLVSGVAHELNNPLSAISNFAQIMLLDESDAGRREMIEMIARESQRAGEIVRNLLSFSRSSDTARRRVRLDEIVKRTIVLRAYDHRRNGIDVSVSLSPELPEFRADPNQMQQVLLNLVVNAEHAIGSGGTIAIRGRATDGWIELEVADDGPGIPDTVRPHIFTPFYTTKGDGKGTGLGLPISREIIERHGGDMDVRSEPGGGACFVVRLPIASDARIPAHEPDPTGEDA